jgi:signal transduction histidine kinase
MRGLAFRIGLVLAGTIVLVVLLAVALGLANWRSLLLGIAMPAPARVGAIADLIEHASNEDLPILLRALNAPELTLSVSRESPPSEGTAAMPGMTLALNAYGNALDHRPIEVARDLEADPRAPLTYWTRYRLLAPHPIRLVVQLRDGRYLVLEAHSALTEQVTGLRLSLLALLLAIGIAGVCFVVLRNQIRPIEQLATAVQRFGANVEAAPLPERGTREIRQLTGAFNRLQSQITALIATRTRMMAAISHDLGTYLTRLRLRAEYISDAEQRQRAVQDIEDMHALMTDTLAMSKLDHDSEILEIVDLVPLARQICSRFENSGGKIAFHAEAPELPAKVRPSIIGRVFENLIANGLKYGQEVEARVSRVGNTAEILVDDRGPGIPASERDAVLEPFYRRDVARNLDQGGFGLGLAIVADIVKRHAGTLSLEDRPGGGLRARVRLPLAAQAV